MNMFRNLMLAGVAVLGFAGATPAFADRANLAIVTEDHDPESVPRHNRIYNRVHAVLSEILNTRNFDVYDETAVCMDITEPNRVRRKDVELISVIRGCASRSSVGERPRPPIDGVVIFTIYASADKDRFADFYIPKVRIEGRVLDVRTGQHLAGFEAGGFPLPNVHRDCATGPKARECLLETVGGEARLIADQMAQALADKLDAFHRTSAGMAPGGPGGAVGPDGCMGRAQNIVVTFTGFSSAEITQAEEAMVRFSCYRAHRPLAASSGRVQYYYETSADEARLFRNLRILMDYLNVRGSVTKTTAGEYLVAATPVRGR